MNNLFDNKTIIKNFDYCLTNEQRCEYIHNLIKKLIPILEKFNNNAKTKSEHYLLELLQKIVEIQSYFMNYDGITEQEFEIVPMITDIVLKSFHNVYKYQEPSEFYKKIEFFIEKCMKLHCHNNGKAILDLAEDDGVEISDENWLKIQSLVFSYDNIREAAKRMEVLICNTYFNLIEHYFSVFNDVDSYRALGEMYNDRPENTELYKLILDEGEEAPKDDKFSRDRDTWTTEEQLEFDKQVYSGMAKHLEKKFKKEAESKLPDPRDFPKRMHPWDDPDEIKKQLKSYDYQQEKE